ncbi:ARF guanine-nucleotide exchange factor GNOM [Selaginella moellendorffii]|nr:ARF guanine-nucleotide exchange factor GNOM [Selaginella moellendorffii]|eukprot:XP_024515281.1 ARF guanine-nucleotide exchange factor GNOM [Selaginella moellendorffii]
MANSRSAARRRRESGALACMISAEVGAVLATMRRNSRWAGRYEEQLDHSLIYSLKLLRRSIFSWTKKPWNSINPCLYLAPFLDVVRSDETGAPITGTALSAVYKILTSDVFDLRTSHVDEAMHAIVESVTSCRFEVTDPASEEAVLMKILQVLLACIGGDMGAVLGHRDVCNVVNTTFRVVHQAGNKSELLQRVARHTMHELVRAIFGHLSSMDPLAGNNGLLVPWSNVENNVGVEADIDAPDLSIVGVDYLGNGNAELATGLLVKVSEEGKLRNGEEEQRTIEPYGVPCMVEIFHFLCSLLNMVGPYGLGESLGGTDEDVPQFALALINSAIEFGGPSFGKHQRLISLVRDELFRNLMQMGLSSNPIILSMVCSIVLNLYHHLRSYIKLQLEAFFSFIIMRLAQGKFGASYQQQEVAMETLVDFCRQPNFMPEMYANFDCDITCSNTFEELANLLSKSAFPVNCPLSAMHVLALEGLLAIIHSMADRVDSVPGSPLEPPTFLEIQAYVPFWNMRCDDYKEPSSWVEFVRKQKYIKRRLMIGADHFNRDPKKGLEFLQGIHLLPEKLDPQSVASFFRYTTGLDKNLLGDFLGDRDDFCLQVLAEFTRTFDFSSTSLDAALRTFLESFRLPGEAQKIERVMDAFSQRYCEQCVNVFANKDAAFVLAYSVIMLNTDQHKPQVKKKMSEDDFIRNLRAANGGVDFPREMLSELYQSVAKNEIRISYDLGAGIPEMTHSRWLDLIRRSRKTSPYIVCDSRPFLDHDMFAIMSGPTIAAISVVFDHAEDEEVLRGCLDGFLAVAKISASHHLEDILDDLVVSLCKFTTLLNPTASMEEPVLAFGEDSKARMAAVTVFTIANKYGDFIRNGWRNILDCILRLHKLGLLPSRVTSDAADDTDAASESQGKMIAGGLSVPPLVSAGVRRRSSGLMSRFSQLLSLEADEPRSQPSEQQVAAHQRILQTIEACHIDNIFSESKFLQAESLLHLAKALIWAAGRPQKGTSSPEDEDTAVFCLELLIAITLNNRDRILLLWQGVYEHMAGIVQTTVVPCLLVEKAVFGLLRICQRLLPYKENLAEELLRSLQLILKLDARVADAFCERITQEVMQLVRANAGHIKSPMGWRTISSLLSITARHPDASESGFEALYFIMHDGAHLTPANYVLCLDAARAFAETRVGGVERSLKALDLLSESVNSLIKWSQVATGESDENKEDSVRASQELAEMWIRLAQGLRRVCGEQREEVRNCAILSLQRCLTAAESLHLPAMVWIQCFDQVIFVMLDDLLDIALRNSPKEYRGMEGTLHHAMKFLSKIFLQFLDQLALLPNFRALWLAVLSRMEMYMKARLRGKGSDKLQELVPELLRNILLIMHARGVLVQGSTLGGDSLWELTWHHVQTISPALQPDIFPDEKASSTPSPAPVTPAVSQAVDDPAEQQPAEQVE